MHVTFRGLRYYTIRSDYMDKLLEKYMETETKLATINGLVMAQAICSRKLHEVYSKEILEVMGEISQLIDKIKLS